MKTFPEIILELFSFKFRKVEIFEPVSVTGTENVIMAASLAEGTTIIENAAREPEVQDLCQMLNKMGAKIYDSGKETIIIDGVKDLTGTKFSIPADRIEAGTYLIAGALIGKSITITNVESKILKSEVEILEAQIAELKLKQKDNYDIEVSRSARRPTCESGVRHDEVFANTPGSKVTLESLWLSWLWTIRGFRVKTFKPSKLSPEAGEWGHRSQ